LSQDPDGVYVTFTENQTIWRVLNTLILIALHIRICPEPALSRISAHRFDNPLGHARRIFHAVNRFSRMIKCTAKVPPMKEMPRLLHIFEKVAEGDETLDDQEQQESV
jgi:hypothetical protein